MRSWADPGATRAAACLAPYARSSFERGATLAARLHAEEISPEHWLAALLADESCAATRTVLHAFADPETIGTEILALCEGVMVVGSGRTLPFSVRAVRALYAVRRAADAREDHGAGPDDLFRAAWAELPPELVERLAALPGTVAPPADATGPTEAPGGRVFAGYTIEALRALGAGCRAAASLGRSAIGPVHVALGCLEVSPPLREATGLTATRLRMGSSGMDEDTTALPARTLPANEDLAVLLAALPEDAQTLDVLAWVLAEGNREVAALLRRQKVTLELVERCRGVMEDPDEVPAEDEGA